MRYNHQLYQEDLENIVEDNIDWGSIKGKNILVTGASGMIGTFLIDTFMKRNRLYNDKIMVYALSRNLNKMKERFGHYLDNPYLQLMKRDIGKEFELEGVSFDFIIHAASNTHPKEYSGDPIGTITTNIFGTYYLLEYVKKNKNCKIVFLSTVEIYGENRGDVTYFEENYCGYLDCNTLRAGYPESKRVSEAMLQAYIAKYDVKGTIIRLCRVYGPTMEFDDSKAIAQFIKKAVKGENIVLKSEGNQEYSYIYVADAVSAIIWGMINGKNGEAYNVSDNDSDIVLRELAEYLAKISGSKVIYELPDEIESKGYSTATKALLNSEKLKNLGWTSKYSLQDGLDRTLKILKYS